MPLTELGLTYRQAPNATLITYNDTTDYDTAGEDPADFVRTLQIYDGMDASGVVIATIPFSGAGLTAFYNITEDKALSVKFTATDGSQTLTKIINIGTTQFERILINQKLAEECGCEKSDLDDAMFGYLFMTVATWAIEGGNFAKFNSNIKTSNKILNG